MTEWVVKANPDKYQVVRALEDLRSTVNDWNLSKNAKIGDTIFMGMSGPNAAILAVGSVVDDPYEDTSEEDLNWIDKSEARRMRWFAGIDLVRVCLPHGVPEARLRASGLARIADFLHRQGMLLRLKPGEGSELAALLEVYGGAGGRAPCRGSGGVPQI